jgi:hypothetical protein
LLFAVLGPIVFRGLGIPILLSVISAFLSAVIKIPNHVSSPPGKLNLV